MRHDSPDGDEQSEPELLRVGEPAPRASESAIDIHAVHQTDENPDEDDSAPAGEPMVPLKHTITHHESNFLQHKNRRASSLVVVRADPGRGGEHRDARGADGDHAPAEDDLRDVFRDVVLEVAHDDEDEPRDARCRAAGVDAADVLQERGPEDPHPERRPLQRSGC